MALYRLAVTLTPVRGRWSGGSQERLVGHVMVDADSVHEALEQARDLAPDLVADVDVRDTLDLPRRVHDPGAT